MPQMTLCNRGIHYYDPGKYSDCPYCKRILVGEGNETTEPADSTEETNRPARREETLPRRKGPHIDRDPTAPRTFGDRPQEEFEPVVGWLVAIEGPAQGRDFRLKPGRNSVGRAMESDVAIENDDLMSQSHATVHYYMENNAFFLTDNNSKHGTFLCPGNEAVLTPRQVMDGARVKVGKTVFVLKTFCNEAFQWQSGNPQK